MITVPPDPPAAIVSQKRISAVFTARCKARMVFNCPRNERKVASVDVIQTLICIGLCLIIGALAPYDVARMHWFYAKALRIRPFLLAAGHRTMIEHSGDVGFTRSKSQK